MLKWSKRYAFTPIQYCAWLFALICSICSSTAFGQRVVCAQLISQNTLHLGYSQPSTRAAKDAAIHNLLANESALNQAPILAMLQEVMGDTDTTVSVQPNGYFWSARPTLAALGSSTYKERYGWLWSHQLTLATYEDFATATNGANIERRPAVSILTCTGSAGSVGLIAIFNYHAVFGKRKSDRLNELNLIPEYIRSVVAALNASIMQCTSGVACINSFIIGGDFNLSLKDVEKTFQTSNICKVGTQVTTPDKTTLSLNKTKTVASPVSNYDHFVACLDSRFSLSNTRVVPVTQYGVDSDLGYRTTVSDHKGISVLLGYTG